MATTTNFGWETPDDTDLVKDGALAMRTLGNAIDASLVDLKGGTTGQVLSKTSNNDMDFTWVTSDDANAIQNSIINAKGDLIVGSANDTPSILSVSADGSTLVADSSASTGLRWQSPVGVNPFINGGFDIWQRGTSVAFGTVGGYGADRNVIVRSGWVGGATMSRQTGTAGIQYAARIQRDSGNTSTAVIGIGNSVETANSVFYQGKTVTFSFYARIGANFSGASNTVNFQLLTGTGTDQNLVTAGYTGSSLAVDANPTLTTSWQRFQYVATFASNVNEMGYYFNYTPVGTAGANDWFEVTGIQLEVGSVATPFRRAGGTLAGEFQACARYYYRTAGQGNYAPTGISGVGQSTTTANGFFLNPVAMRTNATAIEFSNIAFYDGTNVTALTNMTLDDAGITSQRVGMNAAAGLTQYRPGFAIRNNNAAGYVAFSAEL